MTGVKMTYTIEEVRTFKKLMLLHRLISLTSVVANRQCDYRALGIYVASPK